MTAVHSKRFQALWGSTYIMLASSRVRKLNAISSWLTLWRRSQTLLWDVLATKWVTFGKTITQWNLTDNIYEHTLALSAIFSGQLKVVSLGRGFVCLVYFLCISEGINKLGEWKLLLKYVFVHVQCFYKKQFFFRWIYIFQCAWNKFNSGLDMLSINYNFKKSTPFN